jgi:hypothetical protein
MNMPSHSNAILMLNETGIELFTGPGLTQTATPVSKNLSFTSHLLYLYSTIQTSPFKAETMNTPSHRQT